PETAGAAPAPPPPATEARFFVTVAPGVGYASGGIDDFGLSVSGLTVEGTVRGGVALGRLLLLGGLTFDVVTNPSGSFGGLSGSAHVRPNQLALAAGAGWRVTPDIAIAGLARLSKVSFTAGSSDMSSSFGPGLEVFAQWDAVRTGSWSIGVCGGVTVASMDMSG